MRRVPNLPPPEFIAKDHWYRLVPRRSLGKVVALLILLAAVVYFRARAGRLVRLVGSAAVPATGAPARSLGSARAVGGNANSVPSSAP
jgi:hypothetical protein